MTRDLSVEGGGKVAVGVEGERDGAVTEIPTQVTHVDGQVTVGFSRLSSRGTSRLVSLQAILGLLRLRE